MIKKFLGFFQVKYENRLIDNFISFETEFLSEVNRSLNERFNLAHYQEFNSLMSKHGYDWTFAIDELDYTVNQNDFTVIDFSDFDEGEEITIDFKVFKNGNQVVVFDEEKFFQYVESENLHSILTYLRTKTEGVEFYNSSNQLERSNNFLGFNKALKNSVRTDWVLSAQCNFNNYSDFKYSPGDFFLAENPANDSLLVLFDKLQFIFLIVHIFDSTEIHEDTLKTKISGFKTLRHSLDFGSLDTTSLKLYRNIYDWVYHEKPKIEDKLGIVRNILSMYLDDDNVNIKPDVYASILSANNTYIKGNISKYIEVRNKVHDQLEQLSERVNKTLDAFYSNFQKTIFVFISYYLSIFVIRTYARIETKDIFSEQLTVMALVLLGLSFLFMIFSYCILLLERKRIKDKYDEVKERAEDILVTQDIEKLLKDDKEYKSEIKFLNNRSYLYIVLWVITIGSFYIALRYASSYI
tara:strand:+ start:3344 stop:4741 length:1398 start_codon:yes stop_codon:yes gene_type:complete